MSKGERACRSWNSNQIGKDHIGSQTESGENGAAFSLVCAAVLITTLVSVLFGGCTSADPSTPVHQGPILQLVGTKPDSIRMGLAIRYIAQSDEDRCQSFTTESMSMKPKERISMVFPESPKGIFIPKNASVRIVPIQIERMKASVNRYKWGVSLGWFDEPAGCDFIPQHVSVDLYDATGSLVGGTLIKARSWPSAREPAPTFTPLKASIILRCRKPDRTQRGKNGGDSCQVTGNDGLGFEIKAQKGDTTRIGLSVVK